MPNILRTMLLIPKKFYDDGAPGGGGAAGAEGATVPTAPNDAPPIFTPEELTQFGFKSIEEAKAAAVAAWNKQKEASITDDERQRQANLERADMLKYAAENNLINDDFNNYESLQKQTDRDLVFNKFATEFKEDHPDIPEENLEEEIKSAFELEYKLSSTNAKEKARGESRLSKDAKDLRMPAESAYNAVKNGYGEYKTILEKGKDYAKIFKEVIGSTPDKIKGFEAKAKKDDADEGEDVVIEVDLTADEKKEVEKKFNTEKTLRAYLQAEKDGKVDEFRQGLVDRINDFIEKKKSAEIKTKIAEKFQGIGLKFGSNVGAGQPFAIVKNISDAGTSGGGKSAKEEAVASTRRTSNY